MKPFIITTWAAGLALEFAQHWGLLGDSWSPLGGIILTTLLCLFMYRWGSGQGFPLQPGLPGLGWRWALFGVAVKTVFLLAAIVILDSPWDSALLVIPAMWLLDRPLTWIGRRVKCRQPGTRAARQIRHGITLARHDALHAGSTGAWKMMPASIMVNSKGRTRVERPWLGNAGTLTRKLVVRGYAHEHLRKVRGLIHEAVAVLVKDMGGQL